MIRSRVLEALERAAPGGERLLVAVSGGVDSMVLLHVLASLAPQLGLSLRVGHVHHGLRDAADEDAACVSRAAKAHGLDYRERRIDPRALRDAAAASRSRPSLQEASRRLRYEALGAMALEGRARAVATAHNCDDQVETVLLRLFRGTGPDGAAGMRELTPWPGADPEAASLTLLRPLLDVSRAEILEFAARERVLWREDSSNSDHGYARNRLREGWLPGLREAFNPKLDRAVLGFAEALREERGWLESLEAAEADRRFERLGDAALRLDIKDWGALPQALARRLVRRAMAELGVGREITSRHLERVMEFLPSTSALRPQAGRRGKTLELPGGIRVRFEGNGASPLVRLERAPLPPSAGC